MTLSISGFPKSPTVSPLKTSSPGTAFANALSDAASSATAPTGDRAEISAAAVALSDKTRDASPVVDEAGWDRLMQMPENERKVAIAKQADAISKSQGLPPGKYDYEHMSVGQLMVVGANQVQNLGYTSDQTSATWNLILQKADGGTSFGSPTDWTTPRNFLSELTRDRDRLISTHDYANAKLYDAALSIMRNTSVVDARNEAFFKNLSY